MSDYTKTFTKILGFVAPVLLVLISHMAHSKNISDLATRIIALESGNPTMGQVSNIVSEAEQVYRSYAPAHKTHPKGANGPKQKVGK